LIDWRLSAALPLFEHRLHRIQASKNDFGGQVFSASQPHPEHRNWESGAFAHAPLLSKIPENNRVARASEHQGSLQGLTAERRSTIFDILGPSLLQTSVP